MAKQSSDSVQSRRAPCEKVRTKIGLYFSHDDELEGSKQLIKEFWNAIDGDKDFMDRINFAKVGEREKKKEAYEDAVTKEEKPKDDTTQAYKCILSLMLEKGVDRAALAIRADYPLQPKVCTCGKCCCSCPIFSPYLYKLGLEKIRKKYVRSGKYRFSEQSLPRIYT